MASAEAQPVKAVLVARGIRAAALARAIGYSKNHVWMVLNGYIQGGPYLRAAVCKYLDLPEDQLFRPHVVHKTGVKAPA